MGYRIHVSSPILMHIYRREPCSRNPCSCFARHEHEEVSATTTRPYQATPQLVPEEMHRLPAQLVSARLFPACLLMRSLSSTLVPVCFFSFSCPSLVSLLLPPSLVSLLSLFCCFLLFSLSSVVSLCCLLSLSLFSCLVLCSPLVSSLSSFFIFLTTTAVQGDNLRFREHRKFLSGKMSGRVNAEQLDAPAGGGGGGATAGTSSLSVYSAQAEVRRNILVGSN